MSEAVNALVSPGARHVSTGELASQIARQREKANASASAVGGINRGAKKTAEKRAKKARRAQNVANRALFNKELGRPDNRMSAEEVNRKLNQLAGRV